MRLFFTILLNGLILNTLCAQGNPTNILMRTDTVRTCFARFTDNGGINGNYSPNLNQTLVLCPPAAQHPDTNKISISFNRIDLVFGDRLCIFDGIGTSAPALGCNYDFRNRMARATTANTSGCLTVTFLSNAANEGLGWDANVNCDRPCQNFIGEIDYSSKPVRYGDTGWIDLCINEPLNLHAKGVYLQNNMPRLQADSTTNFAWNFGDGRRTAVGQTIQHSFSRAGGYILQLTLTDTATKCQSINTIRQRIRVAPKPILQTARLSNPVCVNTPIRLYAVTNPFDSTLHNIGVIAGTDSFVNGRRQRVDSFPLPDANGSNYNSSIYVQGFPAGQTITTPNDIANICLNMEHSWVRDLEIGIHCPNGQSALLHNYANASGNEWYLGRPNDADGVNPIPGVGWDYCWTPAATQTWRDFMTNNVLPAPRTIPAGNYAPAQPFSSLVGCPLNGNWTVLIRDLWLGDNGFLFSWAIQFRDTLHLATERFSPQIAQHGWVNGSNLTQNDRDSIIAVPRNAGVTSFIYRVKDDFNCTHDTAIGIKVLPTMHPNCVLCSPRFNDLKDTSLCTNELPLRFNKVSLDTVPKSVTFESFPNKILSSLTHPLSSPLSTPLSINSLQATLTDVYTQLDSVCIDLNSRYNSDMVLQLKAPNNVTPLTLMNTPALVSGRNLNICFSPNATALLNASTPIPTPSTPYQGNYQITGGRSAWAALNGAPMNGDWILQTSDRYGNNLDTLKRWSITFKHRNQIKYVWSPSTGLSCTDCPNPTANPTVTTRYIVQTIDSSRCTHRDTVQVAINGLLAPVVVLDSMLNGYMVFRWGAIAGSAGYQVNVNNTGWISANRVLAHQVTGLQHEVPVAIKVRGIPSVATSCDAAIGTSNQVYARVCVFDLQYDSLQTIPIACYGGSTRIQLSGAHAISTAIYSIDGVSQPQNPIFTGIQAGYHFALGVHGDGCRDSLYFYLRQPDSIRLTTATTPSTVGGATGTATVTVIGGVSPYRYTWSRGDTTSMLRNLAANTYMVTITDANGCRKTTTLSIITNHLSDELSEKCDIQIYPNPLIDNKLQIELTFKQSLPSALNLELRDGLGRLISNLGTVSETGRFEKALPDLAKGAYFLIFQSGHLKTVKSIYIF